MVWISGIDLNISCIFFFFFQAEDGIRDVAVTGVQTCALPILSEDWFSPVYGRKEPSPTLRVTTSASLPFEFTTMLIPDLEAAADRGVLRPMQIGRASCRERV